jgi:tryptophan synthase alpha chain
MSQTRIGRLFDRLRAEQRAGLIAYITAGDPSLERTPDIVAALERGGVDLIELGVPFSDPIADGPAIQAAADRALKAGANVHGILDVASRIRQRSEIPLLLFTYMNPVLRYGLGRLGRECAARGIDGCLLTDLSVDEAERYVQAMRALNLDTVFLAAPTSTPRRLDLVAKYSSGFVYLVSRTGVTGVRESVSESVAPLVTSMRVATSLPLAVGFGISNAEQVRAVGEVADAVVVGSAIVRVIEKYGSSAELEERLESFARELAGGLPSKNR